jgi:hypothetical protein
MGSRWQKSLGYRLVKTSCREDSSSAVILPLKEPGEEAGKFIIISSYYSRKNRELEKLADVNHADSITG